MPSLSDYVPQEVPQIERFDVKLDWAPAGRTWFESNSVAHTILVIVYSLLKNGGKYRDLGDNFFDERDK